MIQSNAVTAARGTPAPAGNTSSSGGGSLFGGSSSTSSTQDMFTRLLVAQVQYQDPMKPMDNMQFTQQLASFNQISELQKVNKGLDGLAKQVNVMSQSSYLGLLDKEVSALGNSLDVGQSGGAQNISFNLSQRSKNTVMTIKDEAGIPRAKIPLGDFQAGDNSFAWDGKDELGFELSPGKYSFSVQGEAPDGGKLVATTFSTGQVTGITTDAGQSVAKLSNGLSVLLDDIKSVRSLKTTL